LPSYEEVLKEKDSFINMFNIFYKSNKLQDENGMYQQHGGRFLVHNPPQTPPSQTELDSYYESDFERDAHPYYKEQGKSKHWTRFVFQLLLIVVASANVTFAALLFIREIKS
jgi:hypothetical protein